jgi:putative toxin-antitoxin system antitoxin component (TIGR02293 family)
MARSVWETIGVAADRRIEAVKRGLPMQRVNDFLEVTQLPKAPVFKVLKLTKRDLETRKRLTREESERLWRLASVYESSLALFDGDAAQALLWLTSPQKALGEVSPLDHIVTEPGAAEVQELIGRIEFGVLA